MSDTDPLTLVHDPVEFAKHTVRGHHEATERVMDTVLRLRAYNNDQGVIFADQLWEEVLESKQKPAHSMYIKMMQMYAMRRDGKGAQKAAGLIEYWMDQYKMDYTSLCTNTNSTELPKLFNLMMRILIDGHNPVPPRRAEAVMIYFRSMIRLHIVPDAETAEIVNSDGIRVHQRDCIHFVLLSKRLDIVDFILTELLFPIIGKCSFLRFDSDNNRVITNHIWNMNFDDLNNRLYVFKLNFLCSGPIADQ